MMSTVNPRLVASRAINEIMVTPKMTVVSVKSDGYVIKGFFARLWTNVSIEDLTPKARRTRSALLVAARAELGHRGVAGLNVMAVCERAGVGRTSFYNYFEDTDALVSTVAHETAIEIKERFASLHSDVPRGFARLEACLSMILETAVDDPEAILLVASLASSVPEIMELLQIEISAELAAFAPVPEEDQPVLGNHLAQTVLALAHQMALGNLAKNSIDRHVEFMMRACG
jgi:AcrR family transcriptional regulator